MGMGFRERMFLTLVNTHMYNKQIVPFHNMQRFLNIFYLITVTLLP